MNANLAHTDNSDKLNKKLQSMLSSMDDTVSMQQSAHDRSPDQQQEHDRSPNQVELDD